MTIKNVISNNLCTGCGVCISEDKSNASSMKWNHEGFLVPEINGASFSNEMERVCPFSLKSNFDEDSLANIFLDSALSRDDEIGRYSGLYVGYSEEHRKTSSSGGIATFVFDYLLQSRAVDNLFIVKEFNGEYKYQLFNSVQKIKSISKTRYYPVTLETLFSEIDSIEGTVAVSGVACFIKAIRLKQSYNPELKVKIPFLVGIICGGLKSKYYSDFLAQSAGCFNEYDSAEYRVKKPESYALDYNFSCKEKYGERIHIVEMKTLGDMWGTGLFKSNACDFCDDVTTELADISLGDAWIEPYNKEGLGNSIVITRSILADGIIRDGIAQGLLHMKQASLAQIKESQQGSFNHRHKGLYFRIANAHKNGMLTPLKRERFLIKQSFMVNRIQKLRLVTRESSLRIWSDTKDVDRFNEGMKPLLINLKKATSTYKLYSRVINKIKKIMRGNK
ncbi:Coenzyme F420 hydrogenase/dehydrogenase, beta subunit C-terminal domain [Klebsiella oxytoca]|uniref:Coenzyme F420 hydrogenase/dehydrogenase, beta subunit C-terminal domain n=1 Tax=Klebsiella oxytoca TaxID=571 RepID=UPI00157B4CAE|nr:Coenzyme F420 hydrogenase/dehydrogenase, beta subunit C-terminal domain [Klebsiella oxytoca]